MPKIEWMPSRRTLEEDIAEEEARTWLLKIKQGIAEEPIWQAQTEVMSPTMPEQWQLQPVETFELPAQPIVPPPQVALPLLPTKKEEVAPAFWQTALRYFAMPFNWIEENIIKPSLSLTGTAIGIVPEVTRQAGEDFWEWKKRSWAGWETPGVNINVPWSDEPWRIDVKGVLEFAPWLLLPGAGQVGIAGKAGVGIAGALGRLGTVKVAGEYVVQMAKLHTVGKVLGYAVEYSPWGIVEKTAGVAIKGGFRTVGKISNRISTQVAEKLYGKYVPPPVPESVTKLTKALKEVVKPTYRAFKKEGIPALRARQSARTTQAWADYKAGKIAYSELQSELNKATAGAIKPEYALSAEAMAARQAKAIADVEVRIASGELKPSVGQGVITKIQKNPMYTPVTFTADEGKELLDIMARSVEDDLTKRDSALAFFDFALNNVLPEPRFLKPNGPWARIFGEDFVKAMGGLRGVPASKVDEVLDILNIGRSVQSSVDISYTLRQIMILSLLHPTQVPKWFGKQVKGLVSEKWALEADDAIRADPQFGEVIAKTKGYIAPLREATLRTAEELYASARARRWLPIRMSERAALTYANQARWYALKTGYNIMKAQGATDAEIALLGRFVNIISGRGEIPKSLEKFAPVLNAMLFSPRLQFATLQTPRMIGRMLLSKNPYMRRQGAMALVTFVGGGSAVLGLVNAVGNKVELDPRSGDFGKIKIGETRLDIWRGYVQYIRFAAQMLTGERKSAYGNMNKADRSEIAFRFLQSKGSPAFGLMVDLLRGETYEGKPIFNDTTGFIEAVKQRAIPLALQDVIDAMEQNGINGLWVGAPAMLGIGALTYVNNYVRIKAKIAKEMGYDSWDDIDPKTQREIENRSAELQAATIEFDRQIMGTAWGDWRLMGNAIEDVFRQNVENAVAKYRQNRDGYQFRLDIGEAFTARRGGYSARETMPQFEDIIRRLQVEDTTESLVNLGPQQLAIKTYNDALWGDDMYDEFGDYRFDEADVRKQQLRQHLGEALFNYVEDYMAVKYETFPTEFQELTQAKKILRPYWQVEKEALKLLGEPKTKWQVRRLEALISRIRKRMRTTNPEVAQAYLKFYTRP